ncbi:MAG TPA: FAD-dependent oxidoreductase [Pyrinomonadaceae bacterium]|nr:FAD-dependent oxidoreductase [Pyrinomonadaceae bacterium]
MSVDDQAKIETRCCIAGGGPAGIMLGYLLARAGIDVVVLEKHADFLRDFRGDTIHPSTLEVMYELGVLEDFLKRPHQEIREFAGQIGDEMIPLADLTHLPTHCKFLAFMPQWDFLDFIKDEAERYPAFRLIMEAEVTDLIEGGNQIAGVRATTPQGEIEIRATLVVGCDGRKSVVRERAGLQIESLGAPIDVLWFRLSRQSSDPGQVMGRFATGKILVMLNRDSYWQCAFVIRKGALEEIKQRGMEAFREDIASIASFLRNRVHELTDWDQIKLLTVLVDRLRKWYRPGLLCIGDAAHAMSPVGGVGINLAIQDAVATANLLARPLSQNYVSPSHLQKVQWRREFPTRVTQWAQVQIQNRVLSAALTSRQSIRPPLVLRLFKKFPLLRRIPARLIGIGVRPEHVRTPDVFKPEAPAPLSPRDPFSLIDLIGLLPWPWI